MPPTYLPLGTTPLPSQPQVQGSQAERKVSTCGDGDLHLCQVQGSQAVRKVSPAVMGTCSSARRYERLSEVVELLFPPVARGPSTDLAHPEYSNFCYWREPLAPVDLDALA